MPQTIIVETGSPPERIDRFLAARLDLSRTKIQARLKSSQIRLNDRPAMPHDHVKSGDAIIIEDTTIGIHEPELGTADEPLILDEDDNYLVVNKPSGLITHGSPGIREPTLYDWAVAHDEKVGMIGDQPNIRGGIVHRLDRDVSGVMVIAKSQAAFEDLKQQFQSHDIGKEYIALAHGRITSPVGKIDFAIARKADKSGLMVARPGSTEGRAAETHFHVERYLKGMTLVRVKTLTGRTHQIRVHFKAIGHPLVGDPLYRMKRLSKHKIEPPRLCLHAAKLEFTDLTGQRRRYEAPLPIDLHQFFAKLG